MIGESAGVDRKDENVEARRQQQQHAFIIIMHNLKIKGRKNPASNGKRWSIIDFITEISQFCHSIRNCNRFYAQLKMNTQDT